MFQVRQYVRIQLDVIPCIVKYLERRFHHLFDPGTGRPTDGALSTTVVAKRACDADACSTALLGQGTASPPSFYGMGIEQVLFTRPAAT